jgi:glycosyltransferase involved in cell wall biosynthesis
MTLPPESVWVGAQGAQSGTSALRGIGRYIVEHITALLDTAPEVISSVQLTPALPVPGALEPLVRSGQATTEAPPADGHPRIFHVTSPFEGLLADASSQRLGIDDLWPQIARERDVRTVVTLYDLIPLIMRERYLDQFPFIRTTYTARLGLIRTADHVLTISERTAIDAAEHLRVPEDRLTVIHSGVSSDIASLVTSREQAESIVDAEITGLRRPFLLYVGGDDPRKNLEGMITAYGLLEPELRHRFQLVIVCDLGDARRVELRTYAEEQGISPDDPLLTGFVADRLLSALYRSCELFVFPSIYEGAGLPVLEAMSCDAPVAASAASSIPEILGDLEATFDPRDPQDMASCISRVLGDPKAIESLRERSRARAGHYSWRRVAELTLEGYERALTSRGRPSPRGWALRAGRPPTRPVTSR